MSLLIDGTPTFNIARSQGPTTLVSSFFVQTYFPGRQASSSGSFALTLNSRDRGPLTVVLSCRILSGLEFDVVLALDWKSHLRDLLLHFGHRVPAAFDPWSMLSGYVASVDAGVSGAPLDSSVSLEPSQSTGISSPTVVVKPVKNVKTVKPVKPVLRIGDAAIPSAGGADASAGGADVAASCNLSVRSSEHSPPTSVNVPRNYDRTFFVSSSSTSSLSENTGEVMSNELTGRDRVESKSGILLKNNARAWNPIPKFELFTRVQASYLDASSLWRLFNVPSPTPLVD
ncbi:hypothetical protein R3P38DRAFT_3339920 [Favolaschia claudopus]|uniref:Uncharacterized protein n=1 Tax=Favolaschia claudopus TaxID=2862362 RepID=A0AAW0EHE4_9AGAR